MHLFQVHDCLFAWEASFLAFRNQTFPPSHGQEWTGKHSNQDFEVKCDGFSGTDIQWQVFTAQRFDPKSIASPGVGL